MKTIALIIAFFAVAVIGPTLDRWEQQEAPTSQRVAVLVDAHNDVVNR